MADEPTGAKSAGKARKRGRGRPFTGKDDPRACRDGAAMSRGKQVSKQLREWLEAIDPTDAEKRTRNQRLFDLLWEYATSGDKNGIKAIELLLDRAYGKPAQSLDVTSGGQTFAEFAAAKARERGEFVTTDEATGGTGADD